MTQVFGWLRTQSSDKQAGSKFEEGKIMMSVRRLASCPTVRKRGENGLIPPQQTDPKWVWMGSPRALASMWGSPASPSCTYPDGALESVIH